MTIASLADLRDVLAAAPDTKGDGQQAEYAVAHGLPVAHGAIDWTDLPTFGGEAPRNTVAVWSWDATHLLVGSSADGLRIVARDDR